MFQKHHELLSVPIRFRVVVFSMSTSPQKPHSSAGPCHTKSHSHSQHHQRHQQYQHRQHHLISRLREGGGGKTGAACKSKLKSLAQTPSIRATHHGLKGHLPQAPGHALSRDSEACRKDEVAQERTESEPHEAECPEVPDPPHFIDVWSVQVALVRQRQRQRQRHTQDQEACSRLMSC